MIDIANDVMEMVTKAVTASYPSAEIGGEYEDLPATFPAVTVEEADNSVYQKMSTANIENAVSVMYQVKVYSNKVVGRKAEATNIMRLIDNAFLSHGFRRMTMAHIQSVGNINVSNAKNTSNSKLYCIVARYTGIVGVNTDVLGSQTYFIYQN